MGRHLTASPASSLVSGDVVGAAECLLAFETHPSQSKGDNAYSSKDGNAFYWQRHFSFAAKYAEFINSTMLPGFVHTTQHMATVCRKAHGLLYEVRDDCKNVKTYKDVYELKSTREAIRRYALILFPNLAGTGPHERSRPVLMDETLTERQREKEVQRREKDRDAQMEAEQAQLEQEKEALQRQQETIREREKQLGEERERRGGGGAVPLPLPVPDEDDGGVAAQRMKTYVRYMAARGESEAFTMAQNQVCAPRITPEKFIRWSRRQNRKEHTLKAACFLALNPTMKPLDACKMVNASGNHPKGPEATSYVIRMQNFTRPQIKWMISQLADYHGKAPANTRERPEVECHFTEAQKNVMKQSVAVASEAEKPLPMAWSNGDTDIASIQAELDDFEEAWQPQSQELSSARFKRVITTTRIFDSNFLNDLQQQKIARANLAPLLPKKPVQPTTEADALAQSAEEAVKKAFPKRPEEILDEALCTTQSYTAPQEKGLTTSVPWAPALVDNSARIEDIAGWGRKVCLAKRALPNGWRAFPGAPSTIGLPPPPTSATESFQYLTHGLMEAPLNNRHAKGCRRGSRATKASTQEAARQVLKDMEEQKKALGICVGPTVADAPAFSAPAPAPAPALPPALTPSPTSQVGEAWTEEEDDRLRKVHAENRTPTGYHSWPPILEAFPGRSEGSVKNRWQRLKEDDDYAREQEQKRAKSAAPAPAPASTCMPAPTHPMLTGGLSTDEVLQLASAAPEQGAARLFAANGWKGAPVLAHVSNDGIVLPKAPDATAPTAAVEATEAEAQQQQQQMVDTQVDVSRHAEELRQDMRKRVVQEMHQDLRERLGRAQADALKDYMAAEASEARKLVVRQQRDKDKVAQCAQFAASNMRPPYDSSKRGSQPSMSLGMLTGGEREDPNKQTWAIQERLAATSSSAQSSRAYFKCIYVELPGAKGGDCVHLEINDGFSSDCGYHFSGSCYHASVPDSYKGIGEDNRTLQTRIPLVVWHKRRDPLWKKQMWVYSDYGNDATVVRASIRRAVYTPPPFESSKCYYVQPLCDVYQNRETGVVRWPQAVMQEALDPEDERELIEVENIEQLGGKGARAWFEQAIAAQKAAHAAQVAAAAETDVAAPLSAPAAPVPAPQTGKMDIDKMAEVLGVSLPPETPPAPAPAPAPKSKGMTMSTILEIIQAHPELKGRMQAIVSRTDISEVQKLASMQDLLWAAQSTAPLASASAPVPAEADECKIAPSDNARPSFNLLPALPREKRNQPNMNNRLNSMVLFSCALEHDRFNLTRSQKMRLVATEAKASVDTTEGSWGIADRSKALIEIIGSHKTRLVAQALKERNRRGIIGRIRYMQYISAEYERAKQMALDGGIDPRDYPLPLQTACNKWNRLSEAEQEQFLAPAAI